MTAPPMGLMRSGYRKYRAPFARSTGLPANDCSTSPPADNRASGDGDASASDDCLGVNADEIRVARR